MCTHFGNIYYIPIACFVPTLDAYIMFKEAHRDRKTFWFCKCTKTWRWTHAWVCVRVCVPADRLHNQPVKSLLQAQTLQHPMTSAQCQPASLTVNLHLSLLITPPPPPHTRFPWRGQMAAMTTGHTDSNACVADRQSIKLEEQQSLWCVSAPTGGKDE